MLSNSHNPTVVKQGYAYKRGKGLLSQWRLKFLVLICHTNAAASSTDSLLQVFDQRANAFAKHTLALNAGTIVSIPGAPGNNEKFHGSQEVVFVVITAHRKYVFAAQSKIDRDDWVQSLRKYVGQLLDPRSSTNVPTALPRGNLGRTLSRGPAPPPNLPIRHKRSSTMNSAFMRLGGKIRHDDDAVSVYSASSYAPSAVWRCDASEGQGEEFEDDRVSLVSSALDTLSFCAEPILTPQELNGMGRNMSSLSLVATAGKGSLMGDGRRKKASGSPASQSDSGPEWNNRYQSLLSISLDGPDSCLRQDIMILELVGQFQEAACSLAKKIIDEYHFAPNQAQAEPKLSYSFDGITLHFATNYESANPGEIDEAKAKTSQELRALDVVNRARAGLATCLMCTFDYKGFRMVAYADVPLTHKTLVQKVHADCLRVDDGATERLAIVGKSVHLRTHTVNVTDVRRVQVPLSTGAEVHYFSQTQTYYTVNVHDMFPMDYYPAHNNEENNRRNHSHISMTEADLQTGPDPMKRLRAEFLRAYGDKLNLSLVSEAFTLCSGANDREREVADTEAMRAARFLREQWIPSFIKRLDTLIVRPVDSMTLSLEMHRAGVNIRYLGYIAKLSQVPYIRDLVCIEMVARASKHIFQSRVRGAILHFRSVGATNIDDEMRGYVANWFSTVLGVGERTRKFWDEKLKPEIMEKYDYLLQYEQFTLLHKPAIFLAMQHQCGVLFEDTTDYNFATQNPVPKARFVRFQPRVKHVSGMPFEHFSSGKSAFANGSTLPAHIFQNEDDRIAYRLARHFKSLGPRTKLSRSDLSALALSEVAAHYIATGRREEAKMYAQSAVNAAQKNTCVAGLSTAQLFEATFVPINEVLYHGSEREKTPPAVPEEEEWIEMYRNGLEFIRWHWGVDHPMALALHDRVALMYERLELWEKSLRYLSISLDVVSRAFGKNHPLTAGYLTKYACILNKLNRSDEALQKLTEALHIHQAAASEFPVLSEVHYHTAECLASRGDLDGAVWHAMQCRRMREKSYGQNDPRTVNAYRQVARLVLAPYAGSPHHADISVGSISQSHDNSSGITSGVITPQIRTAYKEAISCYERVFRFLKNVKPVNSGLAIPNQPISSAASISGFSMVSAGTSNQSLSAISVATTSMLPKRPYSFLLAESDLNEVQTFAAPVVGPVLFLPFDPPPNYAPFRRTLLHQLTRRIVGLKLALLESPRHKECVRMLRAAMSSDSDRRMRPSAAEAKEVVLRLAAVSPSVYLDGVLARIEEAGDVGDQEAIQELGIVLQLTESETVGFTNSSSSTSGSGGIIRSNSSW
ncbi:clustered mitochondria-domain-containing protein [Cladochytrium replicatum]|nr:clustered mitochondria-domain-containing protein [Cladochytrium replicatum]